MTDIIKQILDERLSASVDSKGRMALILDNDGRSEISSLILQRTKRIYAEARKIYFSKPVITLPFTVSSSSLRKTITADDQFREVTFKSSNTIDDEVFQTRRYLATHALLRKIINENGAKSTEKHLVDSQIIVDGIKFYDYAITQRTTCALHTLQSGEADLTLPHVYVVDLYYSTRSVCYWLNFDRTESCLSVNLLIPYERQMWHTKSGNSTIGGYKYMWINDDVNGSYESPLFQQTLPVSFFFDDNYSSYVLRISSYGSQNVFQISRAQFLRCFSQYYNGIGDSPLISSRNGFAVIDLQFIKLHLVSPPKTLNIIDPESTRNGLVYLSGVMNFDKFSILTRLARSITNVSGYYCPLTFVRLVKQILFHTTIDNRYIQKSLMHLNMLTKSLKYNYNGYSFDNVISPEIICLIIESLLPNVLLLKNRIRNFSKQSIVSKILISAGRGIFGNSKILSYNEFETINRMYESNSAEIKLHEAASKSHHIFRSVFVNINENVNDLSIIRIQHLETLLAAVESMFDASTLYEEKLVREPIPLNIYNKLVDDVKLSIIRNLKYEVTIDMIQAIYDDLFPGNSNIDYTAMQSQAELNDKKIILAVPRFRVAYATIYSDISERLLIKSKLRTSTAADLTGSFYNMMNALMKRNFNRQASEMSGDRRFHVRTSILNVLSQYGIESWRELVAYYMSMPISPGIETLNIWASKHTESDVKAASTIMANKIADPSNYNAMPKNQAKPILDLTAQGSLAVGQTVVFHSKDIISLSVGIFTLALERLMLLFPTSIRLAFAADEHTIGQWADCYLDLSETFTYEFDVPKFDKSQDMMCFNLILEVMSILGISQEFIQYWRRASYEGTIFNSAFSMVFTLFYGNRSGSGGTLAVNCICLLFAFYTEFANLSIVAALIKGDDSIIVTRREISNDHVLRLLERWGFSLKRRQINKYVSFCSGLFVKNSVDRYVLLRDPVRLLTKLGRALSPERESAYFIDYYVSFVDATAQYSDEIALHNLKLAVNSLYNKSVDVDTIVQFLRRIVVNHKTFLRELYGFSSKSLSLITKLDDIKDILMYAKQQGFIKSSMLKDQCPNLKIPLAYKIRSYSTEMIIDYETNEIINDEIDQLGWIHSI
uniref:RdRp catalytic domain-containing protein n=1 Tax=Uromyces virus A TaxID=2592795 RepID=A0A7G3W8S3_9VIRU|nr:hypothetical protein [Uromyces virus A]